MRKLLITTNGLLAIFFVAAFAYTFIDSFLYFVMKYHRYRAASV